MYPIFVTDVTSSQELWLILSGLKIGPPRPNIFMRSYKFYDLQIEPDALISLFGHPKASFALTHTVQQTLMFGVLAAKRIILPALLV